MPSFEYFVVFAEMRTGSNFLESNLNSFDDLSCHGEAFNPYFIGYPKLDGLLGVSQDARDKNPMDLLDKMIAAPGVNGFRYFHDHDPRILDFCLQDPKCAKVILTRNPVESYVSRKIASATGQWKLTNMQHARSEKIRYDAQEFETQLVDVQAFQVRLLNSLQKSGQSAFYLDYEDLFDVDIINGLAHYLGCSQRIPRLNVSLKKQNPSEIAEKVENFAEMAVSLAGLDRFNLTRTPNLEPRRGPMIPRYIAAARSPLLFMPIKSGPTQTVVNWLSALDSVQETDLLTDFNQKTLRDWQREAKDHRSFTVLRHPVARAHDAFCRHILCTGPSAFAEIRTTLIKRFGLSVPAKVERLELSADYDDEAHRAAFLVFLSFLRGNLANQTAIRVDPAWATQQRLLQGMAEYAVPDMVLREQNLQQGLAILAGDLGLSAMPPVPAPIEAHGSWLERIYDEEIEQAARLAYARDYATFAFDDWRS